jgi:hypothetical protein
MNDSNTIVETTIQRLIQFSRNYSFRCEEEIRGYFLADISRAIEEKHVEYDLIPEHPTAERYSRPDGLRLEPKGKKPGRIDIVLKMSDSDGIGIELEYPRGSGLRNKGKFYSHIRNDLLKLNQERGLAYRYLVVFLYNEPPFDISNLIGELEQEFKDVKFALLVMKKKSSEDRLQNPIQKDMQHPQNWLSFVP